MIRVSKIAVWGFEAAIRGMRHPYKSTSKSDSGYKFYDPEEEDIMFAEYMNEAYEDKKYEPNPKYPDSIADGTVYDGVSIYTIGPKDFELAKKLSNGGDDHGKFLRMIHVQMDVTAPLYWWKEYDTYKVGTVANSESTMHTIMNKEFSTEDFSTDIGDTDAVTDIEESYLDGFMEDTILRLNILRDEYLNEPREDYKKAYWRAIIQLLPEGYNQTRTVDLNYQTLKHIYHARKNHKQAEWRDLCKWIKEELPYSELITGEVKE